MIVRRISKSCTSRHIIEVYREVNLSQYICTQKQWETFARLWWIFDAKWQSPFRCSWPIIHHLTGKHKPVYHPLSDLGDHVVVINTKEISMRDDHWRNFRYYHHTGYPGGFTVRRAFEVHETDPTFIMHKAVYSRLPNNLLRRGLMARLHLYPDENVPDDILKNVTGQIRQIQPVPKRLDEYSSQERDSFPQLFDWPEDYVRKEGKPARRLGREKKLRY